MKAILDQILRNDLTTPGYHLMDAGVIDSRELRRRMVGLKEEFAQVLPFVFRSMMRFNQQVTTRYHQDGGPDFNLLVLGYEPSEIPSRLFLADHHRAAAALGVDPQLLLTEAITGKEEKLAGHTIDIPAFTPGRSYILVVNNSPHLGLMHKAIILRPDASKSRFVSSCMLTLENEGASADEQRAFLDSE